MSQGSSIMGQGSSIMGQGSGAEDLETRTLDLGSGLLGGFGEDGLYYMKEAPPLNAGAGF